MPVVLFLFIKLIAEGIRAAAHKTSAAKPQSLCAGCVFAHVQYGANGRRATSCTYGGTLRTVTLDVLYCTDYRNRNVQIRPVPMGFVPEIQGVKTEA